MISRLNIWVGAAFAAPTFVLLLLSSALAQPQIEWTRTYENSGQILGFGIIRTFDGGVAMGSTGYGGVEEHGLDFELLKIDSSFEIEWRQFYHSGRSNDPVADGARSVIQMPDSGYVLVGYASADGMLVRTNKEGEEIWRRFLDRDEGLTTQIDCVVDQDGNIVVVGGNMAAKFSDENEGEEIWRQTYENAVSLMSIVCLENEGFVIGGRTRSLGAQADDMYAVKINSEGEIVWENAYGTEYRDFCWGVIQTSDGGFCLAGLARYGGTYDNHPLLIRLDADGNEAWQRYDEEGVRGATLRNVVEAPDGGLVGVGYNNAQSDAYVLIRVDYFGEVLWRAEWLSLRGDDGVHGAAFGGEAHSIFLMEDGGYLMGGLDQAGHLVGAILIRTEPDSIDFPFELEAATEAFDFGEVWMDSTAYLDFEVENIGRRYVVIDSLWFEGDTWAFDCPLELPLRIEPTDTAFLPLYFQPRADTTYSATLYLAYGEEQTLTVELAGRGKPYNAVADDGLEAHPTRFGLEVSPNPFNSFTHLSFVLPEAGRVNLSIFNLNGRLIQTLLDGERLAGTHTAVWDASYQPSGVYLTRLECGEHTATKKLTLVK